MAKAINRQQHFPASATQCICGDRFRSPQRFTDHIRVFSDNKWSVGPAWTIKAGYRTALVAPGHRLTFFQGLTLLPHMNKVRCECGWSQYLSGDSVKPVGRTHFRQVVRKLVGA